MKKRKVLVCGASGFIGRNIFEALSSRKDLEVYGTYSTKNNLGNSRLTRVDLTLRKEVLRATKDVDILIHAAAVTSGAKDIIERPYIHITDNEIMNALLLRATVENNISQAIFFGCSIVYPPNVGVPLKETDLSLDRGLHEKYGAGWVKIALEKFAEVYARFGKTRFTVIRHSNIYGPYDKFDLEHSHVFGATITKVMNTPEGEAITVWGDGNEQRDLLFVSDLVNFVIRVIDKSGKPFEVYNAGLGESISVAGLVQKIIDASGKQLSIQFDCSKPTIPASFMIDIGKARNELEWMPEVTLDLGIQKTLAWYRQNIFYVV